MKTLHQPNPGGHTWRDIGGLGGLILDILSLAFLVVVSGLMLLFGMVILILDYAWHPVLLLLAWWRKEPASEQQPDENKADQSNDWRLFLP